MRNVGKVRIGKCIQMEGGSTVLEKSKWANCFHTWLLDCWGKLVIIGLMTFEISAQLRKSILVRQLISGAIKSTCHRQIQEIQAMPTMTFPFGGPPWGWYILCNKRPKWSCKVDSIISPGPDCSSTSTHKNYPRHTHIICFFVLIKLALEVLTICKSNHNCTYIHKYNFNHLKQ